MLMVEHPVQQGLEAFCVTVCQMCEGKDWYGSCPTDEAFHCESSDFAYIFCDAAKPETNLGWAMLYVISFLFFLLTLYIQSLLPGHHPVSLCNAPLYSVICPFKNTVPQGFII